uniref:Uncharacterized protein n=1 Tax=Ditylenchus dipsaci TaxID=166011 RepID=A0A915CT78_9BILA
MLTSSRSISLLPPTLQNQKQQLWIRSLDSVLHNRTAFEAFHKWLSSNQVEQHGRHHPLDALECYLAILAYHKCVAEQDPKSKQMALALHRRFISPKSGTCWFVPMEVRQAVSQSLHSCGGEGWKTMCLTSVYPTSGPLLTVEQPADA